MQEIIFVQPQLNNGVIGGTGFAVASSKYQDNNDWQAINGVGDYTLYNSEQRGRINFESTGDQLKYKGIRSIKYIKLYFKGKLVFKRFIRNKKFYNNKTVIKLPQNLWVDKSLYIVRIKR